MKAKKEAPQGVKRNDLPGSFRVHGKKIVIVYKNKSIATGFSNTKMGWISANEWWASKLELDQRGNYSLEDTQITVQKALDLFYNYKKNVQKLNKSSLYVEITILKKLFKKVDALISKKHIESIIENFIATASVSQVTQNLYISYIGAFVNFLYEKEYINFTISFKKYKKKVSPLKRQPYTNEEYMQIVSYFDKKEPIISLYIQFLWNTGCRASEALNIKVSDIDFKKNQIRISNKIYKGEIETILITDLVKKILLKLLNGRTTGYLFNNTASPSEPLIYHNMYFPFLECEKALNIKVSLRGFHGFRRSFSNRLFNSNKLSIVDIQDAMRHRDINITLQHYKEFNKSELRDKLNGI